MKHNRKFASFSLLILAGSFSLAHCSSGSSSGKVPVSSLTFQEVNRFVQSGISRSDLDRYSQKLAGTRVRWQGRITDIDSKGAVYVSMSPSDIHPNAYFKLPVSAAQKLQKGEIITFLGTINRVSILETFPPMPNTYVLFRDVAIQN